MFFQSYIQNEILVTIYYSVFYNPTPRKQTTMVFFYALIWPSQKIVAQQMADELKHNVEEDMASGARTISKNKKPFAAKFFLTIWEFGDVCAALNKALFADPENWLNWFLSWPPWVIWFCAALCWICADCSCLFWNCCWDKAWEYCIWCCPGTYHEDAFIMNFLGKKRSFPCTSKHKNIGETEGSESILVETSAVLDPVNHATETWYPAAK